MADSPEPLERSCGVRRGRDASSAITVGVPGGGTTTTGGSTATTPGGCTGGTNATGSPTVGTTVLGQWPESAGHRITIANGQFPRKNEGCTPPCRSQDSRIESWDRISTGMAHGRRTCGEHRRTCVNSTLVSHPCVTDIEPGAGMRDSR